LGGTVIEGPTRDTMRAGSKGQSKWGHKFQDSFAQPNHTEKEKEETKSEEGQQRSAKVDGVMCQAYDQKASVQCRRGKKDKKEGQNFLISKSNNVGGTQRGVWGRRIEGEAKKKKSSKRGRAKCPPTTRIKRSSKEEGAEPEKQGNAILKEERS